MSKLRLFILGVLFLVPLLISAQNTITGVVTDQLTGDSLPGVNITVKETNKGTVTDFDGNYTLSNVTNGSTLIFSSIGFDTQSVVVTSSTVNVVLVSNAETLDEVVVIGYGTTTIKDATGSVASIRSKDFNKGNIVTPASLISGRVAGVNVTTDGAPGGGSAIRIRGGSSLSASNDPLIVIDGLPISNTNAGGSRSILASINPNDIASFSILKDASATAIYGSRASNGVIIITTKKGKSIFQANLDLKFGFQTLANKVDVFSADEYRNLINERVGLGQSGISIAQLGNANTDWQEEIYNEDFTADKNFSMRGSLFNKIPARFSLGHTGQPGLRKTSNFERGNASLTLNPKLFDNNLKVNINSNLIFEKNRFADGVEGTALRMDPTQPVYDANSPFGGYFEYYTIDGNGVLDSNNAPRNPVASLYQFRNESLVTRFFGNIELDYKFHFLPELRAVINLGYDDSNGHGTKIRSTESINGFRGIADTNGFRPFLGSKETYTSKRTNKLLDGYLVYNKNFNSLKTEFTAGYSYQKFEAVGFNSGELRDPDSESDINTEPDIVLIGFFGRTNLTYMDKYLLTLSYRRDGTSRFSEANRWSDFPAAAFAWKMSEENFLKESKVFTSLKMRLGWGITGQQDISAAYDYLGRYILGNSISQYILGNTPITVGIPQAIFTNTKWEETTTYNVGFDYSVFSNKFRGTIEVYLKESRDLLADVATSDGSNFSNHGFQNIGTFTSKGLEFSIGTDLYKTDNFKWDANFNANLLNTKIDELKNGQDIDTGDIAGGTGSGIQLHREGFSPQSFFVLKQLYDVNGNPIEGAYADLNQDGVINGEDRYIYKKPSADVIMGFQSSLNYKQFDMSFSLRASLGNYIYNNVNSNRAQYNLLQANTALGNLPTSVLESSFNGGVSEAILSDYYVENASFLKMDNVIFGYTFDKFKNNSTNIRIWTGVQNVFTVTNYSGLDPEVFGGIDNTIYPRPRTFLMGANIKF